MKIRSVLLLGIFIMSVISLSGIASAVPIYIDRVLVDNVELNALRTNTLTSFDKGDEMEIKIEITSFFDYNDVEISARLAGIDTDERVSDTSDVFDVKNGTTYVKKLKLQLPQKMDQDRYKLRIEVADRNTVSAISNFELNIETSRHTLVIKDVVLSPSAEIKAGRALLSTVRIQNYGAGDEDDVKVTFSIPELDVSATDYIDTIEADGEDDDQKSTEELYVRIPPCEKPGTYDAEVLVQFDDMEKSVKKEMEIEVIADETCARGATPGETTEKDEKATITLGPTAQEVPKGTGAIYPITITNSGDSKSFVVSVTGGEWGTFRITPSNIVTVGKGDSQVVYVQVIPKDSTAAGPQVFGISIKLGDKTLKNLTFTANVTKGEEKVNLQRIVEVGLMVLVVILVILAIVLGFSKLRKDDEGKNEEQSYY